MQILSVTFTGVATLLIIGLLGFWLLRRNIIADSILPPLSFLAIDIALPCLIFINITTKFEPSANPLWWTLPLWWAGFTGIAAIISYLSSLTVKKDIRHEFITCLFFQNGIFFPLAIISSMFGSNSAYLVDLFLLTLFYPAFFFYFSPYVINRKGFNPDLKRIFNPVLIATLIAVFAKLIGIYSYIPEFVMSGISITGQMAVPLLMIVLGGNIFIDFKNAEKFFILETLKFVAFKNFILPGIVLGLLVLIKPEYSIALMLILQSAVPPITAAPIIIEREEGNRAIANQFLVASFLVSLISLPVIIMLFSMFFKM
jgi:malate permease and related proteins